MHKAVIFRQSKREHEEERWGLPQSRIGLLHETCVPTHQRARHRQTVARALLLWQQPCSHHAFPSQRRVYHRPGRASNRGTKPGSQAGNASPPALSRMPSDSGTARLRCTTCSHAMEHVRMHLLVCSGGGGEAAGGKHSIC